MQGTARIVALTAAGMGVATGAALVLGGALTKLPPPAPRPGTGLDASLTYTGDIAVDLTPGGPHAAAVIQLRGAWQVAGELRVSGNGISGAALSALCADLVEVKTLIIQASFAVGDGMVVFASLARAARVRVETSPNLTVLNLPLLLEVFHRGFEMTGALPDVHSVLLPRLMRVRGTLALVAYGVINLPVLVRVNALTIGGARPETEITLNVGLADTGENFRIADYNCAGNPGLARAVEICTAAKRRCNMNLKKIGKKQMLMCNRCSVQNGLSCGGIVCNTTPNIDACNVFVPA